MFSFQQYVLAESVDQAYELNQKKNNIVLGGTGWLKTGRKSYGTAIDLSGLGLDTITENEEEFSIGCMVTLRQIETHEGLNRYFNHACQEAVRHIVGIQFRNLATVGGSIYGRFGFSDVLTCFLAMDSYVELFSGGIVPLREFAQMEYDRDILIRLIVKKDGRRTAYQSFRLPINGFSCCCRVCGRTGGWKPGGGCRCKTGESRIKGAGKRNMERAGCIWKQYESGTGIPQFSGRHPVKPCIGRNQKWHRAG